MFKMAGFIHDQIQLNWPKGTQPKLYSIVNHLNAFPQVYPEFCSLPKMQIDNTRSPFNLF